MGFLRNRIKPSYSAVQTVTSDAKVHPFCEVNRYTPLCDGEIRLYSVLREAVPIIDAAICKTVRLVGGFRVKCEDKDVEYGLNKFLANVQVNSCECGAEAFIATFLDQLLTYGTAVGEMVPNIQGDNIAALYNVPLKDVELRTDGGPLNLSVYKRDENGTATPIKYQELLVVSALKPEPGKIYGTSILKGLPFVSGVLLNIYNSIGINWERIGNLRFAVTYKPGPDAGEKAYAKERAMQVATEWRKAMNSSGALSDFVAVGDVNIKVIGADNQILDSQIPVKQMLEQIVAKLSIPPFLLGLSWSTSERMSSQQADILTTELESYRRLLTPIVYRLCSMWARINASVTDFEIVWDNINLQDEVELANARFLSARAAEIEKRLEM